MRKIKSSDATTERGRKQERYSDGNIYEHFFSTAHHYHKTCRKKKGKGERAREREKEREMETKGVLNIFQLHKHN